MCFFLFLTSVSVYRLYCDDIDKFSSIIEQPIPAYVIDDDGQHIRQRVMNAKYYKWNLDLDSAVSCIERNKICVAIFNVNAAKMVKSHHKNGIDLNSKQRLI